MREIQCPVCQEKHETFTGDYRYLESGLDNVIVCGIEIYRCSCGESALLPSPLALHDAIANCLLNQKESLSGQEIKFLRKRLSLSGRDFARHLGVDNATVSHWENGKDNPSELADRLIRLFYANRLPAEERQKIWLKQFFPR